MDEEAGKSKYGDQNVEESAERVGDHDDERVGHALVHREAELGGELVADRERRLRERDARHQAHEHYNYEHVYGYTLFSTLTCALQELNCSVHARTVFVFVSLNLFREGESVIK